MHKFYRGLNQGPLETSESIELLRAIENSMNFRVVKSSVQMLSVDTPEDLHQAELLMKIDSLWKNYL